MDINTLLVGLDFARARLLGTLETIEKSGHDVAKVLAWRPGPGRAHMGWQFLHCAATHHKHVYATLQGKPIPDEALARNYAGGSTPSDQDIPSVGVIKDKLASSYADFRAYIAALKPADLTRIVGPAGRERSLGDMIVLYTWHEAHHQGQIHITWNMYKAAHGVA